MEKRSKVVMTTIMFMLVLLFSVFGNTNIYAASETFSVTGVEVTEKSETAIVEKLDFENSTINTNVVYHKVGDFVIYKITIKNNDKKDYKIKSILDSNNNSYISYEYSSNIGNEIKANSSADIFVTVNYLEELDNVANRVQNINADISVMLEDEKGNVVTKNISINPKTGDYIMTYMVMFLVAFLSLVIFAGSNRKVKTSKKVLGLIITMILVSPVVVKAAGDIISLNINSKFSLEDKYVLTYTNASGEEETKLVKYGETAKIPESLEKSGYDFLGWMNEKGEMVTEDVENVIADFKLSPKWKVIDYTLTYELNGGSAENISTYTIESDDITLTQPTKANYTFVGWTGANGDTPQKEVTISKGSTGNKTYTANWVPEEYTITYELDGGSISGQVTSYNIETESFTLPTPTKDEYTFTGWTGTDLETETKTVTIEKGSTGNRSYTANWVKVEIVEVGTYRYPSTDQYMYFGENSADWKSTDNIRSPYPWSYDIPSVLFKEELTRVRLGFSLTEFVTYNKQSTGVGFVSLDKKRMWFSNSSGKIQDGYWTVGFTQDSIDHEMRVLIESGEITSLEVVY